MVPLKLCRCLSLLVLVLGLACVSTPVAPSASLAPEKDSRASCSALRECLAACEAGSARACTLAADRFRYGSGVSPRDESRAGQLYLRACEARDGLGCAGWGWLSRRAVAEEAFARARPLLEAACALEDAEACVSEGMLRLQGRGGPVEGFEGEARVRRGLELFTAACREGTGSACVRAASLFEAGPAPVRDDSRALVYLQRACDAGVPGGCSALALRYLTGRGVPRDKARAMALFRKGGEFYRASCDAGEAAACAELGQAFALGQGVAADPVRAREYLEKACGFGDEASCRRACELGSSRTCAECGLLGFQSPPRAVY